MCIYLVKNMNLVTKFTWFSRDFLCRVLVKMGDFHCGIVALFQSGTSHCGNQSKWHKEISFRIIKNDFIIVALNQWEFWLQGWGRGGRRGGGRLH